jgi:mannose-6-phosphate isomerase-like protein (cupin superfamily)
MEKARAKFASDFAVLIGNNRSQAAEMVLPPGGKEGGPDNRHRGADQWLFVVSGRGEVIVNGKKHRVGKWSLILIERGETHEIRNAGTTDLRTLNFYVPPAYTKDGDELEPGKP